VFGGIGSTGDRNGLTLGIALVRLGKLGGVASATCSKELADIGGEGC
jgi:hypothetical protein